MHRILYIESSTRQLLKMRRLLSRKAFEVQAVPRFENAMRLLQEASDDKGYDAVILSWPERASPSTDEFLAALAEPELAGLPVLVLGHETDAAKLAWVSNRARTGFLVWRYHVHTPRVLAKLLASQPDQSLLQFGQPDQSVRVLLVDDSATSRSKFRKLLERAGYQTTTASHAEEALQQIGSQPFDIALIDYFMPGVNGDELCRRIKALPMGSPVHCVLLTSTYMDSVIRDALDAGAVECLLKNESDALFLARIGVISKLVQMTRQQEQERQRLHGILSSVGEGVYGVDTEGRITFVNPAVQQMLGYEDEAAPLGEYPLQVFHAGNRRDPATRKAAASLARAIEHGAATRDIECTYTRQDGTPLFVELSILPLDIGGRREGAVIAFRDISRHRQLEEELRWQSAHDQLTGLLNRRHFEAALEQEIHRLKRSTENSALIYVDLDHFKFINDTVGHAAGDQLLIQISQLLQQRLRRADLLARLGGDEFALLLHNISEAKLHHCADEIRSLLSAQVFEHEGREYQVQGSVGVALLDAGTPSGGTALTNADLACHIAKSKGRNRTHVYDQQTGDKIAMDLDLGWSIRLHNALQDNDFVLYYQPIVALESIAMDALPEQPGRLWHRLLQEPRHDVYYEALLRLRNPNQQIISPGEFLPTAERFNLMPRIDSWVINEALEQLAQNHRSGNMIKLSLNLSGQSIDGPELLQQLREGIARHHLLPSDLLLEITESCAIEQLDAARHFIAALRELGCWFALDDFGSGHSSFAQLRHLAVDIIKIDGQFVQNLQQDPMNQAIVRALVDIAHAEGKKTVAEFVEDADTLRLLRDCGVDYGQGYYISRPLEQLPMLDICNASLAG